MHEPHESHILHTAAAPTVIDINPSGEYVAVGCEDGNVCIFKLLSGGDRPLHTLTADSGWGEVAISSAAWISVDVLLCGRMNGLVLVVKIESEGKIHAMNFEAANNNRSIWWIAYNSDLNLVAVATSDDVSIWAWKEHTWDDFKKRNIFRAHTLEPYSPDEEKEVRITSLHWVKRRKKVKSALIISFMFHGVKLVDPAAERDICYLPIRTRVGSMSISNDETMAMINSAHRGFQLHSLSQQSILHSFGESVSPSATSLFVESDRAVAYVSSEGSIRLWDIHSRSVVLSIPHPEQSGVYLTVIDAHVYEAYGGPSNFASIETNSVSRNAHARVWKGFTDRHKQLMNTRSCFADPSTLMALVVLCGFAAAWYIGNISGSMMRVT